MDIATIANPTDANAFRSRLVAELKGEVQALRRSPAAAEPAYAERIARLEAGIERIDAELTRLADRVHIAEVERDSNGFISTITIRPQS